MMSATGSRRARFGSRHMRVSVSVRDGKFHNNNGTVTTAIPSSSRRGCNYEHVSAVIAK